jgi:hypothetical protein
VNPRAIVWLEGLDQLKNLMTYLGIKPATFQHSVSNNYAQVYFKYKAIFPSEAHY